MLQIDNICIYDLNCNKLITSFTNMKLENLKDGILCFDNESKLKFWMNIYGYDSSRGSSMCFLKTLGSFEKKINKFSLFL